MQLSWGPGLLPSCRVGVACAPAVGLKSQQESTLASPKKATQDSSGFVLSGLAALFSLSLWPWLLAQIPTFLLQFSGFDTPVKILQPS